MPGAAHWHVFGGDQIDGHMIRDYAIWYKQNASLHHLTIIVNEAAELTPERIALICMIMLGLPFGNAAVGYAANTALPGGLNIQNARGGFKFWASNFNMLGFTDVVIVIKGGLSQDELDNLAIPGQAGLGFPWPPAAPVNPPSALDILAMIDEMAGHFGTEKQSVIGLDDLTGCVTMICLRYQEPMPLSECW